MKLSLVTTLYHSERYVKDFYIKSINSINKITHDYELIFVDDGSPDSSLNIAKDIQIKDSRVTVVELSRNFGHHKAVMTGLSYATGDYVFLIDSDLEEDPELLGIFWDELQSSHADVIYGVQKKRKTKFFEKWMGIIFGKIINYLSGVHIPENVVMIRLMTQRYVKNLLLHTERELVFVGIAALTGFKQKQLEIDKHCKGQSTYTLRRKISLAINYVTCLSNKPLVYIFYIGFIITCSALSFMCYLLYYRLVFNAAIGWTSLITSIWLFGGLIILFLGIIGIYLSKIFIEVKNRPYTIIKEIYSMKKDVCI